MAIRKHGVRTYRFTLHNGDMILIRDRTQDQAWKQADEEMVNYYGKKKTIDKVDVVKGYPTTATASG